MKIALLGSNLREVDALNLYFFKEIAPREGLELLNLSLHYRAFRDKSTGDLYIIRTMNESIKGYKFDKIYYSNTIKEDLMGYVYGCLWDKAGYDCVGDRLIKLGIDVKFNFTKMNNCEEK